MYLIPLMKVYLHSISWHKICKDILICNDNKVFALDIFEESYDAMMK